MKNNSYLLLLLFFIAIACDSTEPFTEEEANEEIDCIDNREINTSRGECNEDLDISPMIAISIDGDKRIIRTNNIPDHKVGKFGAGQGSLNPNAIAPLDLQYEIELSPTENTNFTSLLRASGGIDYSFGVLLNGIELDPVAAEPWPHSSLRGADPMANWDWNLEALNALLGLDCNNAHVQASGQYHHHGSPTLYLESIDLDPTTMTLIGYAADGFPVYYKYAYSDPNDAGSGIEIMTSSYQLKEGERPGDGVTAPCGNYNGLYTNDYEYKEGLGSLDQANGRKGVTPEYPQGTYYYVITDEFPSVPRFFKGTPSGDFRIGGAG